jgi:hypothetical protein
VKTVSNNFVTISAVEFSTVLFFLILVSGFYYYFDPNTMLKFEVFPWDASSYRSLAESLHFGEGTIYERNPFSYRILFPWLYGYIHNITGISYIYSSLVLNLFSSWVVLMLSYVLWRRSNCSRVISWAGLIYFSILWIGPIRYSIFYPGGSFAFDILLIVIFFLIVTYDRKRNLFITLMSLIVIFMLSLGRETITYMTLFVTIVHILTKVIKYKTKLNSEILLKVFSELEKRDTLKLVLISISSILGYVFVRTIVYGQGNQGIAFDNIITFGWFHLHIAEFIYPYFYAFGTIALIISSMLLLKKMRIRLYDEFLKSIENFDILFLICICAVIFSTFGGTDSDRYLLWFFPFFSLFALKGLTVILTLDKKIGILALLFFSALFSSRFYVPSTPYFFFPGSAYSSQANIKTNYDPSLYYGPSFMERFRLPLKKVPSNDVIALGIKSESLDKIDLSPQIPTSILKESPGNSKHWFKNHYKYEINNIPFPLGFSHNQFELFAAHPSYGGVRIRIYLLFQWLVIFVLMVTLLNKSKNSIYCKEGSINYKK